MQKKTIEYTHSKKKYGPFPADRFEDMNGQLQTTSFSIKDEGDYEKVTITVEYEDGMLFVLPHLFFYIGTAVGYAVALEFAKKEIRSHGKSQEN